MLNPFALVMGKLTGSNSLAGAGVSSPPQPVPRQLFEQQVEPVFRDVRAIHHEELALVRSKGNRRNATMPHEFLRLGESETRADTALAIAQAHLRQRTRLPVQVQEFFRQVQEYLRERPADGYSTPVETPRFPFGSSSAVKGAPFDLQEAALKTRWWDVVKSYGDVRASIQ